MARPLRIEYAGAIYHVMSRGNARQAIFRDDADRQKLLENLEDTVANGYARRHRRPGHLFQGRFKGELIEDESYFWTVSRYLHLNPVRGKRPLVKHPRDWPWSSYPGYADKRKRLSWVAYICQGHSWLVVG